MSAKVDQTLAVEPHSVKMSTTTTPASSSGPKVSMFAAKSGFVIPKNKLSGSLIPIFRGGKKPGGNDAANEENTNQVQRKTKWGPDLTQDAAVRRGRALAYQTRVDQITQQLKLGTLEVGDNEDSPSAAMHADLKSSSPQVDSEKSELLELEKREAIGAILKLNPSYKAPPDYKPLLKEARVPIPVKEYPGYNSVGLIFGPGSDTQKRLEKETGAKIHVYGTKAKTGVKVQISPSDGNESQDAYKELYVHISAETFEKVDAAVALIEMLVTSVLGNLGAVSASTSTSGDNVTAFSQDAASTYMVPTTVANQGVAQPVVGPTQTPPQGHFQFRGPWFPMGSPQTPMRPPLIFSAPILNSPVLVQPSPLNHSNMPSLFGPRPGSVAGFNSIIQNSYMPQTRPLGHTGPPNNFPMSARHPSSAQPNLSAPPPFIGSHSQPTGPLPMARPLMSSLPQPVSSVPPRPLPDWSLTPAGSSTGWSGALAGAPRSLGPNNMGQLAPPMVPPHGHRPVVTQPGVASSAPPSNISAANMASPAAFPSGPSTPQLSGAPVNRPPASVFASVPPSQVGPSPALSSYLHSIPVPVPMHAPTQVQSSSPNPSMNPVLGSAPTPSSVLSTSPQLHLLSGIPSSVSGSTANFTLIKPSTVTAPKPHPSSGDFTFQPHQSQNLASQHVPRPSNQPMTLNITSRGMVQPPAPQVPSFRLAAPNSIETAMQVFPRPHVGTHMGQPQSHMSAVPFAGNPTAISAPPRLPAFSNASSIAPATPVSQMGPRNFGPVPPMPNLAGSFPPGPGNPVQLQQNYPSPTTRPENLVGPSHRFSNNPPFVSGRQASIPSGGQQTYDPFSPTSVPNAPQQVGGNLARVGKQENDPEYEDLMASVGVK